MDGSARAPRRIVTALNDDGLSYLARVKEMAVAPPPDDRPLDEVYPGWETGQIPEIRVAWGCEELPFRLPVDPALTPAGSHPVPSACASRSSPIRRAGAARCSGPTASTSCSCSSAS